MLDQVLITNHIQLSRDLGLLWCFDVAWPVGMTHQAHLVQYEIIQLVKIRIPSYVSIRYSSLPWLELGRHEMRQMLEHMAVIDLNLSKSSGTSLIELSSTNLPPVKVKFF